MKTTPHTLTTNKSHQSEPRGPRAGRSFPQVEHHYQSPTLRGGCGTPAKFRRPAFFRISNDYFAQEAPRGFAVDAAIFGALILTAVLPIVNSVQAVATLIHTLGVL
jgi:hypothetical protein